jgi:hypothetical protein
MKTYKNVNTVVVFILVLAIVYLVKEKYTYNLSLRQHQAHTQMRVQQIPINVATRGLENYRQIGILTGNEGKVLPLYGRRTYSGSNKWNYFTKGNDHLSLKIPLSSNGRGCEDNTGCDEIYDKDVINVPIYDEPFNVKLYNNTPRYIPYL